MGEILLNVENLSAGYRTRKGDIVAVDRVSFDLKKGEFLGIAGESGCGKSTLAYAIMNILEDNGQIFSGSALFDGQDIVQMEAAALQNLCWNQISMVFQSAMNSLNPVIKIKDQMMDAILAHDKRMTKPRALDKVKQLLNLVDIPIERIQAYPHQLSGGMKQRVMIAMALVLDPQLIIMDEPTTALDVVVQRSIMEKIGDLQEEFGFSVIFITHDLSLLVEISDRLAIMYGGQFIEYGPALQVYENALHPYTKGLMRSFPPLTADLETFAGIDGTPPDFLALPPGCRFYPRCTKRMPVCKEHHPSLESDPDGYKTRCYLTQKAGSDE